MDGWKNIDDSTIERRCGGFRLLVTVPRSTWQCERSASAIVFSSPGTDLHVVKGGGVATDIGGAGVYLGDDVAAVVAGVVGVRPPAQNPHLELRLRIPSSK